MNGELMTMAGGGLLVAARVVLWMLGARLPTRNPRAYQVRVDEL